MTTSGSRSETGQNRGTSWQNGAHGFKRWVSCWWIQVTDLLEHIKWRRYKLYARHSYSANLQFHQFLDGSIAQTHRVALPSGRRWAFLHGLRSFGAGITVCNRSHYCMLVITTIPPYLPSYTAEPRRLFQWLVLCASSTRYIWRLFHTNWAAMVGPMCWSLIVSGKDNQHLPGKRQTASFQHNRTWHDLLKPNALGTSTSESQSTALANSSGSASIVETNVWQHL